MLPESSAIWAANNLIAHSNVIFLFAINDTSKLIIPVSFPLILICDKLHLQVAYSDVYK